MAPHLAASPAPAASRRAVVVGPARWGARKGLLAVAAYFVYLWLRRRREGKGAPWRPPSQGCQVRRAAGGGRGPGDRWEEGLPAPIYQWEQLATWRVVRFALQWLVRSSVRKFAGFLGQHPPDWARLPHEIDLESAFRQKRWGSADPASLRHLVGNTPMLAIEFRYNGEKRRVFCKLESRNLTGSVKDRMALHILEDAYKTGKIAKGDMIVEASSGNTGISFAAMGRAMGHPVAIFMPDWMSAERKALIRSFGAQIIEVSALQGGFIGSIHLAEQAGRENPRVFLPRQFCNPLNAEAHEASTAPETFLQLARAGLRIDAFAAGVGTGGTVVGFLNAAKGVLPSLRIHPVEPAESPILSLGKHSGTHRIQGISDEFVPPIMAQGGEGMAEVIPVPDGDAVLMAQKLAQALGVGVGISAGANFLAAVAIQERMGGKATVATVLCDDNKKYLSTALARPEPLKRAYLSQHLELLSFTVLDSLPPAEALAIAEGPSVWQPLLTSLLAPTKGDTRGRKGRMLPS